MVKPRTTKGFWSTLIAVGSAIVAIVSFLYGMYESIAGSKFIGMPAYINRPYQLASWTALGISAISFIVCVISIFVTVSRNARIRKLPRNGTPTI